MDESGIYMFPGVGNGNSGIDATTALLLGNNGGFGNGFNNPLWMMFMYPFILPFFNMFGGGMWGNGMFGGNNNGVGFLANQLNNDAGRDLILQAINGRADALGQLAQITHTSVDSVRDAIATANIKLSEIGAQNGLTGLQVINAVQNGNATLGRQLCECCCENRLAIANQTSALQSQMAANDANVRLQLAQNEAADQLAVCQQTNSLSTQASNNTNTILSAIKDQNAMIVDKFCELEKRELQNKINTQGDIITQLRNQISNDNQTLAFNKAMSALDDKIDAIAAKQPNTVPVTWPNLVAANATPYVGGYGYGYGNGFGNGVIL